MGPVCVRHEDLGYLVGIPKFTAEFLGGVLLDYLDLLDDFIGKLPEGKESGKDVWIGSAFGAQCGAARHFVVPEDPAVICHRSPPQLSSAPVCLPL